MNGGRRVNKSSSRCATICLVEMSRSSTPCPASSRDSSRPTSFRSGCPASSVSSAAASRPWSLASFSEIASLSACPSRGKEPVRSTRGFSSLSTACVGARSAAISPASAPERSLTAPASSTIVSADMSSGGRSARASFVRDERVVLLLQLQDLAGDPLDRAARRVRTVGRRVEGEGGGMLQLVELGLPPVRQPSQVAQLSLSRGLGRPQLLALVILFAPVQLLLTILGVFDRLHLGVDPLNFLVNARELLGLLPEQDLGLLCGGRLAGVVLVHLVQEMARALEQLRHLLVQKVDPRRLVVQLQQVRRPRAAELRHLVPKLLVDGLDIVGARR
eukprot:scaffold5892_cov112-Isochrysis_galbana.AAC.10